MLSLQMIAADAEQGHAGELCRELLEQRREDLGDGAGCLERLETSQQLVEKTGGITGGGADDRAPTGSAVWPAARG